MLLSRWRRIATGIAAGVIVLCSALVGASFRDDNTAVSVASEIRGATPIPIEIEPDETSDDAAAQDDDGAAETADDSDSVTVIEEDELPSDADDQVADATETPSATPDETESPATDDEADDAEAPTDPADSSTTADEADDADTSDTEPATEEDADAGAGDPAEESDDTTPPPAPTAAPAAPLSADDDALGTGGGVDDAECALDRLVIYAGARVGGVAGQIRAALAQAGFAAGCQTPVTVLASNCPLQFAGVLGAGSGYDPTRSYVASSPSVDRETMTAVLGTIGYTGNSIDILDFGFVNPDQPGEQWMAIFVPPSFEGWQNLAGRAGLAPSSQSLCAPSGELAG